MMYVPDQFCWKVEPLSRHYCELKKQWFEAGPGTVARAPDRYLVPLRDEAEGGLLQPFGVHDESGDAGEHLGAHEAGQRIAGDDKAEGAVGGSLGTTYVQGANAGT